MNESEPKTELDDFKEHITFLNSCCLKHGAVADPNDIARVVKWSGPSEDSTEYGIFQLKSKAFAVLVESSDYTGHG